MVTAPNVSQRVGPVGGVDGPLLARVRAALDRWEELDLGPTSSLTGGGAIEAFESEFARACGASYALGLPSGTLALRTALAACGVAVGTNVVVPGFDWPAAAAAVVSLGARPVPADVGVGSFLLDPEAAAAKIDRETRAVVVTHLAGVPADVDALREVCARTGVALVEDCSQAFGARVQDAPVGGAGAAAVFSIGPGKLVEAGEGGVLVTDDADLYRSAVRLTQHPTRQMRAGVDPDPLALAARLHPLAAILGIAALETTAAELERRRAAAAAIVRVAASLPGVVVPAEEGGCRFSWSSVPALIDPSVGALLAAVGLRADALGGQDIGALMGRRLSNVRDAVRLARRLHLQPVVEAA